MPRQLNEIADEIYANWKDPYFGAVPYIAAMRCLTDMSSVYGVENASSIVAYFLANAKTWRGEVARRVKKELNSMLKQK